MSFGKLSPRDRLTVRIRVAAEMLGIGRTKLYELIGSGEIDVIKIGSATLISVETLSAFVERQIAAKAAQSAKPARRGRPRVSFTQLVD